MEQSACYWESYAKELETLADNKGPEALGDDKVSGNTAETDNVAADERLASRLCDSDIKKLEAVATPAMLHNAASGLSPDILDSLAPESHLEVRKDHSDFFSYPRTIRYLRFVLFVVFVFK